MTRVLSDISNKRFYVEVPIKEKINKDRLMEGTQRRRRLWGTEAKREGELRLRKIKKVREKRKRRRTEGESPGKSRKGKDEGGMKRMGQ